MCSLTTNYNSVQVNLPAETGDMGVLANHVPSIEQLKPGLVEVIEESGGSKQFFCTNSLPKTLMRLQQHDATNIKGILTSTKVSGGFAVVQPGSILSINAVEGFPLEDFSADAVRNQIAEEQKVANGGGSEQDVAEAKIALEVLETLQAALK